MNKLLQSSITIDRLAKSQDGVFSVNDLKSIFKFGDPSTFYRTINKLVKCQVLAKFAAGIYVYKNYNPQVISQRICNDSYVSFGNILAENIIIGSIPGKQIWAIKKGPSREYTNNDITIKQLGINKKYFFGFDTINGIKKATKEKALLDVLYFYQSGTRFSFNIFEDINYDLLDHSIINNYLKKYLNPKFISFVKRVINGNK